MSNLLITVIAIALVAVVALVGIYYGGAAFNDGTVKASANKIVTQGEQIIGAWNMYVTRNGGSYDGTSVSGLASGGTYLSAVPTPPDKATVSNVWTMISLVDNTTSTGLNGLRLDLDTGAVSNNICLRIAQMAGGDTATPKKLASSSDTDRTPSSGRRFDCLFWGSGSTPVAGDAKIVVYNVATSSGGGGGGSATIGASPTSLTFSTATSTASATQNVTVTNSGTVSATTVSVSLSSGASYFTISNGCSGTLAASASCTVTVNSNSIGSGGTYTGTLAISSANGGSASVSLTDTVSAPSGACTATGAGTSNANGIYSSAGTYNGYPYYSNSNSYVIYNNGSGTWRLAGCLACPTAYSVSNASSTCPLTSWSVGAAPPPAPTTN